MSLSSAWVCHVPIPYSNTDIYWQQHWSLYANADCGWMSVCGCVCVCANIHCLCQFGMLIHNTFSSYLLNHSYSSYPLCHRRISVALNCVLSSAESGDTYQRQVLSIFSIASGICLLGVACMALYRRNKWVMPASTTLVDYAPGCAERALYYHGIEPNEILSMSQQEDVLAWYQIWIVQGAFGTETHVRFIIKVALARRYVTKCFTQSKIHTWLQEFKNIRP